MLSLVNTAAYGLTIITWMGYAGVKATARETNSTQFTSHRWDRSLGDLRNPAGEDSLIPMFEGMVDRAFSRSPREHSRSEIDMQKVRKMPTPSLVTGNRILPKDLVR
jgi:hypothetical protein